MRNRPDKSRPIIAVESVAAVFSDARIRELAPIVKLPLGTDLGVLGARIREAVGIYARDFRVPNVNKLHNEIAALYNAAHRRSYEHVADLIGRLSPQARELLVGRAGEIARSTATPARRPRITVVGRDGEMLTRAAGVAVRLALPVPSDFRDEALRDKACDAVVMLCWTGSERVKGRHRPRLYAPEPRKHLPKRGAERNFVVLLRLAWLEATGKAPSRTAARHHLGPFARLVRECLRLAGAHDVDVVDLINAVDNRRRRV